MLTTLLFWTFSFIVISASGICFRIAVGDGVVGVNRPAATDIDTLALRDLLGRLALVALRDEEDGGVIGGSGRLSIPDTIPKVCTDDVEIDVSPGEKKVSVEFREEREVWLVLVTSLVIRFCVCDGAMKGSDMSASSLSLPPDRPAFPSIFVDVSNVVTGTNAILVSLFGPNARLICHVPAPPLPSHTILSSFPHFLASFFRSRECGIIFFGDISFRDICPADEIDNARSLPNLGDTDADDVARLP